MTKPLILVVDDEDTVREVLRRYLEREGYPVAEAADGRQALQIFEETPPGLVVLDWMLPGMDGLEVADELRRLKQVPIIMLTAKGAQHDRILGLESGVDDYVVKPFSPRELVLRVAAVLRRSSESGQHDGEPVECGGMVLNPQTHTLLIGSQEVDLTAKEFDLLHHLMRHPRQVFSRDQLLDQVWGFEFYGDPSTVTVHIRRLREKIEPDPSNPVYLLTVWGVGYKFQDAL
ncbi:MAG: response regulator transcription factor [Anaerolineales bacterium]